MPFTQHGATKYKFAFGSGEAAAIEAATGLSPQELQISKEPEFQAEADGTDGAVEAVAVGPMKRNFTLTGFVTDKVKFEEVGNSFEHDGKYFIVMGGQVTKATRDFVKGQLTGTSYENVTEAVPEGGGGGE